MGTFYFADRPRGLRTEFADRGRSADGYADGNADGRRCALSCDCPRGTLSGEGRR